MGTKTREGLTIMAANEHERNLLRILRKEGHVAIADHLEVVMEGRYGMIVELHEKIGENGNLLDKLCQELEGHMRAEEGALDKILSAFPNQDVEGHRAFHESLIEAKKAEAEFWRDLRADLLKKGIFWSVVILLGLIATGITVKLGMSPPAGGHDLLP